MILGLLTYTDWWQPLTGSVIQVGGARRQPNVGEGIPSGLLATLDERDELCRRMLALRDVDRRLLFLWYVQQLAVEDIARDLGISRRQCFRRRNQAIRALVDPDESDEAA